MKCIFHMYVWEIFQSFTVLIGSFIDFIKKNFTQSEWFISSCNKFICSSMKCDIYTASNNFASSELYWIEQYIRVDECRNLIQTSILLNLNTRNSFLLRNMSIILFLLIQIFWVFPIFSSVQCVHLLYSNYYFNCFYIKLFRIIANAIFI